MVHSRVRHAGSPAVLPEASRWVSCEGHFFHCHTHSISSISGTMLPAVSSFANSRCRLWHRLLHHGTCSGCLAPGSACCRLRTVPALPDSRTEALGGPGLRPLLLDDRWTAQRTLCSSDTKGCPDTHSPNVLCNDVNRTSSNSSPRNVSLMHS